MTFLEIHVGDIVRLRKQHPCGGYEWEVMRTGADIGIVCLTCRRRLMLPRDKFRRAVKTFIRHAPPEQQPENSAPPSVNEPTASN